MGDKLSEALGQNVIDRQPSRRQYHRRRQRRGEGGADGYTLFLGGNSQIILSLLMRLPYDVFKDFTPVTILAKTNYILVVNPALPANNLQEFIAYAKRDPGQLNVASVASGSGQHLMGELFNIMTGVKMQHVPYKGGQQGIIDLMGGSVQASFSNANNVIQHIRGGRLRGLAITGEKRTASLPQLPTYAEAGLPGYDPKNWQGMMTSAGTPPAIINRLSTEVGKILPCPTSPRSWWPPAWSRISPVRRRWPRR